MNLLIDRTKNNIGIAIRYLRIRIHAIAILEAIANLTGGDTSLSFLGDMSNQKGSHKFRGFSTS